MKFRRLILVLIAALMWLTPAAAAGGWEEVQRQPLPAEHIESEDIDITTRDGYVYVTASRPVTIKIFTILGQTVASATLTQGTYRFRVAAKGIYILKVGSVTRRITI